MQVTFLCLYLFFYISTLWCLLLFLSLTAPVFFATNSSFISSFSFLKNYTKYYSLVYILFFFLSGLPPVGVFFFKFSLLVLLLQHWNLAFAIIILILLFINTLFYLQIFKFNRQWVYLHNIFLKSSHSSTLRKSISTNQVIFPQVRFNSLVYFYNITFFIFLMIFFLLFSIFFISDLFLCFMNISVI